MLYAVIAHCPVLDGKFSSYDEDAALAVPGVDKIVALDDRIAVVAENSWAAIKGRSALKITWDEGKNIDLNSDGHTC